MTYPTSGQIGNPSPMGAPVPDRSYAVSTAYHRLANAVNNLHGVIGDVQGRISPILGPEQDKGATEQNTAEPMSGVEMADAFTTQAAMIEQAVTRLVTLFKRVEL